MKTLFPILFVLVIVVTQARSFESEGKTVQGKVVETVNGVSQPVALAYVFIENSDICTYTHEDGTYSLNIPKGKHEMKVVFKGYKTETKLVNAGKEVSVNFILTQSDNNLVVK